MTFDPSMPAYLRLLRQAWKARGQPSTRALSRDIGFSHTTIHAALTGRSVPTRKLLKLLADVLTTVDADSDLIIDAYDAFKGSEEPEVRLRPPPRARDADVIASAIREGFREVAEAIRELRR